MFFPRMGDKDRRVEFIQEYTLKSMRLKSDKWNKIIIFDEQRQYLQVREAHMSLCFVFNLSGLRYIAGIS